MRSSLSPAAFLAGTLLIGSSSAWAQGVQSPRTATPPTGNKVAVIDINHIFKNHARFEQSMDAIKKDIEAFENYLKQQREQITAETQQLQSLPAGSPQYTGLEEKIAKRHAELSLEATRKRKDVLEREAKVYYNAYQEIVSQVESLANHYQIDLVLRFSSQELDPTKRESVLQGINRAVVFQRGLNITPMVLEALNTQPAQRVQPVTNLPQIPRRR